MELGVALRNVLRQSAPKSASNAVAAGPRLPRVALAPGADENGLAIMLGDLVRQNLEAKQHKMADFDALDGRVAIVAEDADVALTLVFESVPPGGVPRGTEAAGRARPHPRAPGLTIHDGIVGIPDVTIRGPSEAILALSNVPLWGPLGLPFPARGDAEGMKTVRDLTRALRAGELHFYGMLFHLPLVTKLTRVMSVNG
jgi:hypothetical protein